MGRPHRGKVLEFDESVLAHLPEVGKGSVKPAPTLADKWKSAAWAARASSKTYIWSEQTKELCTCEVYDESQSTDVEQLSKYHRN